MLYCLILLLHPHLFMEHCMGFIPCLKGFLLCNIVVDIVTARILLLILESLPRPWLETFPSCMEDTSIFGNLITAECLSSYFKAPTTLTRMVRGKSLTVHCRILPHNDLGTVNWQVKRWQVAELYLLYSSTIPSIECQYSIRFRFWCVLIASTISCRCIIIWLRIWNRLAGVHPLSV